jgi:hypothetical protein
MTGGSSARETEIFSDGLVAVGGSRFSDVGDMNHDRIMHTATLLDDGRILITGGANVNANNTGELYNPQTKIFSRIEGPMYQTGKTMQIPRYGHTATKLANGKVLIVGAENRSTLAELFDPATDTFTQAAQTQTLIRARQFHTATLLNDGKVLIYGGYEQPTSLLYADVREEYYDPSDDSFYTYSLSNASNHLIRINHTATRLRDGRVLVTGGSGVTGGGAAVSSAVIFDPTTQTFQNLSSQMNVPRSEHTATLLNDGYVLIVGGMGVNGHPHNTAELFDPFSDMFLPGLIQMTSKHMRHTAVLLRDGTVMIAGGEDDNGSIRAVEICTPEKRFDQTATPNPNNYRFTAIDNLGVSRSLHTATAYIR